MQNPTIRYVELGQAGSYIIRTTQGKMLSYGGTQMHLKIPKWSNSATHKENPLNFLPKNTPIGVLTGYSNIMVLDFDDATYYDALALNDSLPEEKQCTLIAQSLGKVGGHLVYKFSDCKLTRFINNKNGKKANKLDTLYGNTLVYWGNDANKTKQTVINTAVTNGFIEMPEEMQDFVIEHYGGNSVNIAEQSIAPVAVEEQHWIKLRPLVDKVLAGHEEYLPSLLTIITPRATKALMKDNVEKAHLIPNHPDRIPEGGGAYTYLQKISYIMMNDISINIDTHKKFIAYLNSLFSEPIDMNYINKSILDRDTAEVNANGEPYNYDEAWNAKSLVLTTLDGDLLEIYMTSISGNTNYMSINHTREQTKMFNSASAVADYVISTCKVNLDKKRLVSNTQYADIISRPDVQYGYDRYTKCFNVYKWNKVQEAFYHPQLYFNSWSEWEQKQPYDTTHPRYPKVTLRALEQSVGQHLYNLFLPFMRNKFMTREHSPLFFVFYGPPHSFKSAVVSGVFGKLAENRIRSVGLEILTDKYNEWQVNSDFVVLDEVHQYSPIQQQELIKTINSITGMKVISGVRRMREAVDDKAYNNELTFVLTTNAPVKLTTEVGDRRMVVFQNFTRIDKALEMSHLDIQKAVQAEQVDFAYFLSTQIKSLKSDAYLTNYAWKDENYETFQDDASDLDTKILFCIQNNEPHKLIEALIDRGFTKANLLMHFSMDKSNRLILRLLNTNNLKAKVPGLFNNPMFADNGNIKKQLRLMQNKVVLWQRNEYYNSEYTGSKKTEWIIAGKYMTDDFKDFIKVKFNNILETLGEEDGIED